MKYTQRYNINRGYMKLDVWQEAIELLGITARLLDDQSHIDLRLRSQILDAAQSVSSNIAEGYCRRTVREYIQYIGISLGSAGELLTRMIGLKTIGRISEEDFNRFDTLHYSVENKLVALRRSLEQKKREGSWQEELKEQIVPYRDEQE